MTSLCIWLAVFGGNLARIWQGRGQDWSTRPTPICPEATPTGVTMGTGAYLSPGKTREARRYGVPDYLRRCRLPRSTSTARASNFGSQNWRKRASHWSTSAIGLASISYILRGPSA